MIPQSLKEYMYEVGLNSHVRNLERISRGKADLAFFC